MLLGFQSRESLHIKQALDRQKAELKKATEEKVELELRKERSQQEIAAEIKVLCNASCIHV